MFRVRFVLSLILTLLAGIACAANEQATITKIVAEQLRVEQSVVGPDTPLSKIGKGADGLDVVEIIMAIERAMNVEISDANVAAIAGPHSGMEQLPAMTTVRKLTKMASIARRK